MKPFNSASFILGLFLVCAAACESAENQPVASSPAVNQKTSVTVNNASDNNDNNKTSKADDSAQAAEIQKEAAAQQAMPAFPVQTELGENARETLAYLLFLQGIFDEDEAQLLEAAQMLSHNEIPADVWRDGGIWLVSRKSPNSIPYLEQARKSLPDDISLLLLYTEALSDHDMVPRGIELLREYLHAHPDSMDSKIELALLYVRNQQFAEAQKILDSISPKQRTDLVDYYQAKALIGMGKNQDAIPYLRRALKGMPDFAEALAELAFLYEQAGNLREARNTYEKLQKLQFSPQEVDLRLISLSLKLKQPEKALQFFKQGPKTLPFQIQAANLFMENRHFLQAENILKQAINSENAPIEVYLLLADLEFEQRKKIAPALEWLDKIPPDMAGFQKSGILRAQLLAEAGKIDEALAVTENNRKLYPDAPEFADMQIRLLVRDKNMEKALDEARAAHAKWPDNSDIAFLLASILDETGKKKEAMDVMENIIAKFPEHYQALNYVGFTLAEENRDIDRAIRLLTKANELAPNQAFILDSLAWALYRANRLEEALEQIRLAIARPDASDPAIWEHYGDIAVKLKRRDEAKKAYRKSLELKPDNASAIREKMTKL